MLSGGALLATLAMLALAWHARQALHLPPTTFARPAQIRFEPYLVGIAVAQVIIPVALIYLFSGTQLFRRVISGAIIPKDTLKLFVMLALIQFTFMMYDVWVFKDERAALGYLVVIAGGLLGGWPVGLGLGIITFIMRGMQQSLLYDPLFWANVWTEGWPVFLECGPKSMQVWFYLENIVGPLAMWAGTLAGISAAWLKERRFHPVIALTLSVGVEAGAVGLASLTWENPLERAWTTLTGALVAGVAMAAIALIVRNVQAQAVQRKAEASELARAQAELRALRAQINPHFLFNALNTIRYFVRTNPETARRLLLDLSEIFQRTLRSGEFVPLRDEQSFVAAYLALEKARLDERLQIEWIVPPNEETFDLPVPTLILQPIVENAVLHGIARKPAGGTLRITIAEINGDVLLQVEDDGPGITAERLAQVLGPESSHDKAIGLRNVDRRLKTLYGEKYRLDVRSESGQGTCAQIRIPIER